MCIDENYVNFYFKNDINSSNVHAIAEFIPFYDNSIDSLSSSYEKQIPICSNCCSYANCYNHYFDDKMECSICNAKTSISRMNSNKKQKIEYKKPFYMTTLYDDDFSQKYFKLTEYFVISKSIFKNKKILDTILDVAFRSSTFKHYGIAIFHGSVSYMNFMPSFSLKTITTPFELHDMISDNIFCSAIVFKDFVKKAFDRILELEETKVNDPTFIFSFCKKVAEVNHTTFHVFLDENDFNLLPETYKDDDYNDYTSLSNYFLSLSSKFNFSIYLRNNSLSKYHKSFELSLSTNGSILFFTPENQELLCSKLKNILTKETVYDGRIKVITNGRINNICGHGLTSFQGIHFCGVVEKGEKFYIEFEFNKDKSHFIQFIFYYTDVLASHRALVITVDLIKEKQQQNVLHNFINRYITQEIINNSNNAKKSLEEINRKWNYTANGSSIIEQGLDGLINLQESAIEL